MTKYITTPIYYLNGHPHLGHAYTTILGDVLKRLYMMRGEEVFYTTGTDEHGQKNQEMYEKLGMEFAEFSDMYSANFKNLFDKLDIKLDYFVRTSAQSHKDVVTKCLENVYNKGLIIKKDYVGLYCKGCEQFKKECDLDENGFCPDHLVAPERISEENYFLKLEPYRQWLIDYIKANPEWIQPSYFATEILNLLKEPLEDLNISRPKSRTSLGIELPFDKDYVTYIWFDALINYISSLGWSTGDDKFDKFWPNSIHLMGKDIIKPHCIYWPIMLQALGLTPPKSIMIHGYLIGEGNVKMSKSLGNVVDPFKMVDIVGVDAFRFYMAHTAAGSKDTQVSERLVKLGYKTLANNLGNLHMRTYKMLEKYSNKAIPNVTLDEENLNILNEISTLLKDTVYNINSVTDISKLPEAVIKSCSILNAYIDKKEPWKLAKDETKREELLQCLYCLADGIRLIGAAITPIMPTISDKIFTSFAVDKAANVEDEFLPVRLAGDKQLGEVVMLFPMLLEEN